MAGKKILIVDDDQMTQAFVRGAFIQAGFAVFGAVDGMQGPMMARQIQPDLIVLDLLMPAGGGSNVLQRLRQMTQFMQTPVLLYSSLSKDEALAKVSEDAFTRFVPKPSSAEDIVSAARALLGEPSK